MPQGQVCTGLKLGKRRLHRGLWRHAGLTIPRIDRLVMGALVLERSTVLAAQRRGWNPQCFGWSRCRRTAPIDRTLTLITTRLAMQHAVRLQDRLDVLFAHLCSLHPHRLQPRTSAGAPSTIIQGGTSLITRAKPAKRPPSQWW